MGGIFPPGGHGVRGPNAIRLGRRGSPPQTGLHMPVSFRARKRMLYGTAIQGIWEGCGLAKRGHNEVRESLREMARIYQPKDARKFVREYIRKYRITGGYEDELTMIVEHELGKINSAS